MSGDVFDYSYGQKKVWRKWCWNRLCEKVGPHRKDKTILYLSGPDDYDRKEGVQRGFKNSNIIAVDLSDENIDVVRKQGGFGLCDDLYHILLMWPYEWKIDVLIADFCQGISDHAFRLMHALIHCSAIHSETVIWVNLMRGRDPKSNYYREQYGALMTQWSFSGNNKHRGEIWFWMFMSEILRSAREGGHYRIERENCGDRVQALVDHMQPVTTSYKSTSNQYFDTIIFINPASIEGQCKPLEYVPELIKARQKISALKAIRTMRAR